jgi:predicted acylesterase/phospholipase RssA
MAGAISAGAYTAGVMDFLIEALDEWQKAKAAAVEDPDALESRECPIHSVRIKVIAGASAGGMTAGLAAGLLGMEYESVTRQPTGAQPVTPVNNNLYRSWVNAIDIEPMLGVNDLEKPGKTGVQSLLDSSVVQTIADNAFQFERPDARRTRTYVADPLHLLLTVTNLRGVPYAPEFTDCQQLQPYEMTLHADYMHFTLGEQDPADPTAFWLKPYDFHNKKTWGVLLDSAIASGAFPIGLAPRILSRPPSQYNSRQWLLPAADGYNRAGSRDTWVTIPPHWPSVEQAAAKGTPSGKPYSYDFLCVDGGVMDNEPLDLARYYLIGPGASEPTAGPNVNHAVIMIMPFPNASPFPAEYRAESTLIQNAIATFTSLIDQARFDPQELLSAQNPEIYSRFLIVPRRGFRTDGTLEPNAIACGSLSGFGGFLARQFREHDYQLGRLNCQHFLQNYFALPSQGQAAHPLFAGWSPEARARFRLVPTDPNRAEHLPIIPLMGKAAVPVAQPVWPRMTQAELTALQPKIENRLERVLRSIVDENVTGYLWGPIARAGLKAAWWAQKRLAVDSLMNLIERDLKQRKLM